jgi:protein SERAC1
MSSKQDFQRARAEQDLTVASIVAVHGLGGDWEDTWTDDKSGRMWLRDFVPQQLPSARVWSFGYDSAYSLSKSETDIDDAARSLIDGLDGERQHKLAKRRPIIFIAHSLGGIVVKRVSIKLKETLDFELAYNCDKALILANDRSDHWKDVRDSAAGAIFFAVPHRGSDAAYWAMLATNVVNFATLGSAGNTNFVKSLTRNSLEFSKISDAFVQLAERFAVIRTFYETVKIGNQLVSRILYIPVSVLLMSNVIDRGQRLC